nr:GGDEF domain-containing protein [Marichromatium bheemlicum]
MRGRRFSEAEQERIEGLLGLAAPALKNALAYQTVLTQLESDPLTGLGNRVALFREGAHWLADAVRQSRPLSMLVLDLDGFKRVNDQFGHPEGDRLLKDVAKSLRAATRASDLCVRMGGDEFVILLPGTDLAQAMECAERVRQAIAHCSSETATGVRIGVCASIGVATHRPGLDLDALYAQADDALYAAKRAGRNRTLAGTGCATAMVRDSAQPQAPLC